MSHSCWHRGDGNADLAVASGIGSGVSVLLGNGNGTFQAAVNYAPNSSPGSIAVADFNGDGNADLVITGYYGYLSLLLGNGNGTFQSAVSVPNASGQTLAVGDVNGDGMADLVVPPVVLLGNGNGTFRAPIQLGSSVSNIAKNIALGDFNGDGKMDLALPSDGGLSVLIGNGDGTFRAPMSYFVNFANGLAVADFNADGRTDVAVASNQGISVFLGTVSGPIAPTADSVAPATGVGLNQSFTFKYSSVYGYQDLTAVDALFNTTVNGAGACFVAYYQNQFYLYNDAGTSIIGPLYPNQTLSNTQCTLMGSGTSVTGAGNTLTMVLNLIFNSSFQGTKNVFMYATDSAGSSTGWQNRGTWTIPIPQNPPTADLANPNSGGGNPATFTFQYSAPGNTYTYLRDVYALFNTSFNGAGACFVLYDRPVNGFYLYNDAGNSLLGPLTAGTSGSLSNSQCTVTNGAVSGSGNTLSMSMKLTVQPSFAAKENIFMYAADNGGLVSGWQNRGTWVTSPPPTADSVTPNSGLGPAQSFTFKYSSPGGAGYLRDVYALVNSSINGAGTCFALFDAPTNGFYLYDDLGIGVTGPLPPGSGGSLSNSRCTLTGTGSSVSSAGNTLTMVLNLSFTPSFQGTKTMFLYAADNGGFNSGWQNRGTWTAYAPPSANSVSPTAANGASQTFNFSYSSVYGYGSLTAVYALFNGSVSGINGCFIYYDPAGNLLYLANDAGTTWIGPVTPGGTGTLQNSQCAINAVTASVEPSGNILKLNLTVTATPSFGSKSIFGYAADNSGRSSGWRTLGSWNSTPGSNPTADSVTPNAAAGNTQNFTFSYLSSSGFANISSVFGLINSSLIVANACFVQYYPSVNLLYLASDSGTTIAGSVTPGVAGTVQNSQCTISGIGSSVSGAGNTLTLTVAVTATAAFNGTRNVYGYASSSTSNSGWQALGTWTVTGP